MLFHIRPSTKPGVVTEGSFDFKGAYEFSAEGGDWELILFDSGTLTWLIDPGDVDICLVAGGAHGGNPQEEWSGEVGGKGGEVVNITNQRLSPGTYTATVGQSDEDTSLAAPNNVTWTARTGEGSDSGRPGQAGALAWGDLNTLLRAGVLYGAGGGYGSVYDYLGVEYSEGAGGNVGTADDGRPNGYGGSPGHRNGYDGLDGTGQGAGGGRREWTEYKGRYYYEKYDGGKGGSGAILIRNHKEVSA